MVTESVAPRERGPVFWYALRASLGRVPLWGLTWLVEVLLVLGPTLLWYAWFADALERHYEPGSQLYGLDRNFRTDHGDSLAALSGTTGALASVLALVALLGGAFFAGGWLQVFLERTEGRSVRRFLFGGARYFWRFVRVLVLTLLLLSLFGWLVYGWPWDALVLERSWDVAEGDFETLGSEWIAVKLVWLQSGVHWLLFALVLTWGDYTRTRLALHETRSALAAGFATFFVMLRHPIKTLRPMLLLALAEALVLMVAAPLLHGWMQAALEDGDGLWLVVLMVLVTLLALAWSKIVRGARYSAAILVSRDVVRPLSRPDPWSQRVGGPGGPQYPLGGDEYGVSL